MDASAQLLKQEKLPLSVILPTYNESQNISAMIDSIADALPRGIRAEIIVVDDSSPDGTGDIAQSHARSLCNRGIQIEVIRRPAKMGLSSAILAGANSASGEVVVVMDSDMSHPPQTIPHMLDEIKKMRHRRGVALCKGRSGSRLAL